MADPDHNVVDILDGLLSPEGNWTNEKPEVVRPRRGEKSVPPGTNEYVLIAETTEHFENWRGPRSTLDHGTQGYIEVSTITSDDRRREIKDDMVAIFREARDRSTADENGHDLGGWDSLDYAYTFPDEEIFDVFPANWTLTFRAWSRTPD